MRLTRRAVLAVGPAVLLTVAGAGCGQGNAGEASGQQVGTEAPSGEPAAAVVDDQWTQVQLSVSLRTGGTLEIALPTAYSLTVQSGGPGGPDGSPSGSGPSESMLFSVAQPNERPSEQSVALAVWPADQISLSGYRTVEGDSPYASAMAAGPDEDWTTSVALEVSSDTTILVNGRHLPDSAVKAIAASVRVSR